MTECLPSRGREVRMEVAQPSFRTTTPFRAPVPKTSVLHYALPATYLTATVGTANQYRPSLESVVHLDASLVATPPWGVRGRQVQLTQRLGEDSSNLDMTAAYCETSGMHAGCQRQEKPSHALSYWVFLSATAAVASQSRPVDNPGCQASQASLPVTTALQIVCRLQHRRTETESRAVAAGSAQPFCPSYTMREGDRRGPDGLRSKTNNS